MKLILSYSKGNSQGIRLPKHLLDAVKWQENDEIEITTGNDAIVIKKSVSNKRKNIKELFANFDDEYIPADIDWGNSIGEEI